MSDNSFLPGIAAWAKAMGDHDAPFLNEIKKQPMATRPIIGYTEDRRGIAPRLYRIGQWLRLRFARFDVIPYGERDESDDGYYCGGCYRKRSWAWVDRMADRCRRLAPQPIYDPDWVDPNPPRTTVEWGMSRVLTDEDFNRMDDEYVKSYNHYLKDGMRRIEEELLYGNRKAREN